MKKAANAMLMVVLLSGLWSRAMAQPPPEFDEEERAQIYRFCLDILEETSVGGDVDTLSTAKFADKESHCKLMYRYMSDAAFTICSHELDRPGEGWNSDSKLALELRGQMLLRVCK